MVNIKKFPYPPTRISGSFRCASRSCVTPVANGALFDKSKALGGMTCHTTKAEIEPVASKAQALRSCSNERRTVAHVPVLSPNTLHSPRLLYKPCWVVRYCILGLLQRVVSHNHRFPTANLCVMVTNKHVFTNQGQSISMRGSVRSSADKM